MSTTVTVTNGMEEDYLYSPDILNELNFDHCLATYKPPISHRYPGEDLLMRPLCLSDYDRGFIQLLSQLTKVGDVTKGEFEDQFCHMKSCSDTYFITVIEDTSSGQVIGAGSLVVEQKFIHHCSARGRVEDIVVNNQYRGKQLGKLLVDVLTLLSKKVGCYKTSLECNDSMVQFYSQLGFVKEEGQNYMCQRFKD
ncbi:hypothetical protein ScPMuIL_013878 [Solemya velum]